MFQTTNQYRFEKKTPIAWSYESMSPPGIHFWNIQKRLVLAPEKMYFRCGKKKKKHHFDGLNPQFWLCYLNPRCGKKRFGVVGMVKSNITIYEYIYIYITYIMWLGNSK